MTNFEHWRQTLKPDELRTEGKTMGGDDYVGIALPCTNEGCPATVHCGENGLDCYEAFLQLAYAEYKG